MTSFREEASRAKMTSFRGRLAIKITITQGKVTAQACCPAKIVSKAE